ncbi:amino acid adenylation domain-containing protein [Kineosporia sp. NBRC 101731]|uniref:non-ribosomal peptide synthetase n=1 Tax=Kineosporia sp. NBRC 101731 TaxID=3032199 RepID=UPI0024A0C89B|nr:amino acid adenylation domain-containing protein [Kineosporia sp. NBRC 101731]GLY28383.1 hypothetical protein Kisp02_17480 [Kineosporia sp. NBRC 101731]
MTDMTQRLALLPAGRRARFLSRLREGVETAARRGPAPRGDTGPVPLSTPQETLRFLDQQAPHGSVAGAPLCLRLRGDLDGNTFHRALAAVVARHDALRTVVVEREGSPAQVIVPEVPVGLSRVEAEGEDADQRLGAARARVRRLSAEPFDLSRVPVWRAELIRVGPDDHLFVLDLPALVCDDRSRDLLIRDLAESYRSIRQGGPVQLPDLPVQHSDYGVWCRERLRATGPDQLGGYWRDRLAGAETLEFPTDRPRGESRTFAGERRRFAVGHEGLERGGQLARETGARLPDVLTAAFLVLLQRYCGQDDLVIGSPYTDRRHEAMAAVVGCLTDLRVLRADLSGDPVFRELIHRVVQVRSEAEQWTGLSLGSLVEASDPAPDPSRSPVFQIVFGIEEASPALDFPQIVASPEPVRTGTSRFDMSWSVIVPDAAGADAELHIDFSTDLFDVESMARFARHYDGLLRALTATPDIPLSDIELLSPQDLDFLSAAATGPVRPIRESTVVEQFEARVREAPDSVAVVAAGIHLSYAELDARANRLAALLRERGARPGARIGLCLRRDTDLPTAVLAVLKTGAAYVPLDPSHPPARVADVASDAGLLAVIAHSGAGAAVSGVDAPVVVLDEVGAELDLMPAHDPPLAAGPGDVAYVIYTSGSTGKPKGVLLEHRGVVSFIDSCRDLFVLTPQDRVLGFASATFDVSVFEMFSALLTGARLYLATDDERLSVDRLQALMEQAGITVIDLPPTVMPLLAPETFDRLRIAFVGGEAFSGELVNRWNPGRRLFNGYGPTECTVTMIVQECSGTWDTQPPIGLPMANHVAHVLDRDLRPVPVGVPGELVIGGAGLARGYLDRDELTSEKFIIDPFGTAPGGRLYRTGDLVKRLPDGRLSFLGRLDQQVKIRGLRIELGEVESALTGFDGVETVSVRAWTDENGSQHLVGFLTGITQEQVPQVRQYLGARLPSYMIPSYFVLLEELPLTGSGKVDWRRLPAPDVDRQGGEPEDDSLTPTQRSLLQEVLAPLLRGARLGARDDFFLAGGNSLQAVQLMSAIRRRYGVEIALSDFFASPTVVHLAATIDAARERPRDHSDPLSTLENLRGAGATDPEPLVLRASGPSQVTLLHPSGGELFCYVPLVRALREDIGVQGFVADPADAAIDPDDALVVTAGRIARSLIAHGLPESHCLAGWSYGGVLAFEVARQIERDTGQRPPVVLLDAAYDEDSVRLDEEIMRQRFVHDVARLAGRAAPQAPELGSLGVGQALKNLGVETEFTESELDSRFQIFRSCALAMQEYRPPAPYGGPVTVLTASPDPARQEQWRAVCTGPFLAQGVPADHYTLFAEPALSRVAAAIEETLTS